MSQIPLSYSLLRSSAGPETISYGFGGIQLDSLSEIPDLQVGYSIDPSGKPLVGGFKGSWQEDWLVIGTETLCGDPIFISTKSPNQVMTAHHGQGEWDPKLVAPSVEAFVKLLAVFRRIAVNRGNPVESESNPPAEAEVEEYLTSVSGLVEQNEDAFDFWKILAEIEADDEG